MTIESWNITRSLSEGTTVCMTAEINHRGDPRIANPQTYSVIWTITPHNPSAIIIISHFYIQLASVTFFQTRASHIQKKRKTPPYHYINNQSIPPFANRAFQSPPPIPTPSRSASLHISSSSVPAFLILNCGSTLQIFFNAHLTNSL